MEEIELKGIDEKIYYEKVNDELPIYIWQNKKVNGIFSSLCVRYGSIDQEFKLNGENKYHHVPKGIAHFIEHLNFYEPDGTTATDFYQQYGSEVNAFTTFDYTCYYVYHTGKVKENLGHLLDFVLTPFFNKKMIQKEKNIIIEELKMDEDLPENQLYFTHYGDLFHKYKYNERITGSEDDVRDTTIDDINLVYRNFYHPENMFLVVTGNVNPYEIEEIVAKNLKEKNFPEYVKPKLKKVKEPATVVHEYTELTGNVENTKVKISIKTPKNVFKNVEEVKLRLMVSLLLNNNFGPTSDLKEELMEKELINYLNAGCTFIGDYLIISVNIETKYPKEAIKRIEEALANLDIDEESLRRKINSNIATLVLNYDDIVGVNQLIQDEILTFKEIITNVKEQLESITLDNMKDVLKKIDSQNKAVTVLYPEK